MGIKHLVISGGAQWGFMGFGILYEAISIGFFDMSHIESIYACSAGAIIGSMLAMKISPDILRDYLIKRPWNILFKENKCSILNIYDSKGFIQPGFIENLYLPLLKLVSLPIDISLQGFYEYSGIEMHIFTTEVNRFGIVDLSYKTHPDWRLVDAIHASCAIPLIFSPLIIGEDCYIDAAILMNYPIAECCKSVENPDEIFGITLSNYTEQNIGRIHTGSNLIDFMSSVLTKMIIQYNLFSNDMTHEPRYQIHCYNDTSAGGLMKCLYEKEYRHMLVNEGIDRMKAVYAEWNADKDIPEGETDA